uniref:Fc receptor like 6 n=1 Tax=Sus scrofa TaxID=9823 RepID=A0A8D1DUC5_PIG
MLSLPASPCLPSPLCFILHAKPDPMLLWTVALLFVPCVGKTGQLSLQVRPNPMFEGNSLTLKCQGRDNTLLSQVKFYKNGKFLHLSEDSQTLSMGIATVNSSGLYHCTGNMTHNRHVITGISKTVMVQVQELFPPPVLRATPSNKLLEGIPLTLKCQTKLHHRRPAQRLRFSFHKDSRPLQTRVLYPELHIRAAKEGDSGLYWCEAAPESGQIRKRSPQLEIRVRAPVSQPLLTLRPTGLAVGDVAELLCEAQSGSPPVLYSFYLNGEMLGNRVAPCGRAASLLFRVTSERDAGNYSCEAENSVSKETSKPGALSLYGLPVLSAPTSSNGLVLWLPASLLGLMVIAAALLGYFRPWRKTGQQSSVLLSRRERRHKNSSARVCSQTPALVQCCPLGPLPPQDLPPEAGGEQHLLNINCKDLQQDQVHCQNENDDGIIYSEVYTTPNENDAKPAKPAQKKKDISVIYAEVRTCSPMRFQPRD